MVDSITQSIWTYAWGLHGLEKATKTVNGQTALTQDFTTDPQGRILSMTYSTPGEGYDGELYFHYDHYGNTTLLTDTDGDPVASFQYDLHSGKMINEWNENNLEVVNYKSKYNIICFNINIVLMIITQTNCAGTYYNIVSNNYRIKFDNIVAFISTCDDEPVQKNCWCYYASYDHEGNVRDSASLIFSETDLEGDHLKQIYKNDLKQHGFTDQEITDIENATSKCSKKNGYLQCITMQDRENFPNCCLNCTCHPNDSTKDKQDIGKSIICEGKSPKESGW